MNVDIEAVMRGYEKTITAQAREIATLRAQVEALEAKLSEGD
jgi:polyhydroxyalkanoate synthesis regulator phasin